MRLKPTRSWSWSSMSTSKGTSVVMLVLLGLTCWAGLVGVVLVVVVVAYCWVG